MDGSDADWEYEYDDDETEDLYFTLDLTTYVPNAVGAMQRRSHGKARSRPETATHRPTPGRRGSTAPNRLSSLAPIRHHDDVTEQAEDAGKLQVLDLHTANPFVKFNQEIYSCNWHTDLGTQFYVATPGIGIAEKPLRPGNVLDVIGTSRTRLICRPALLKPRVDPAVHQSDHTPTSAVNNPTGAGETATATPTPSDFSTLRPGQQLVIPRDRVQNKNTEQQASFLERLSAIKLKRGETDMIPVGGVRLYTPPADKEAIRTKALEKRQNDVMGQALPSKRQRTLQESRQEGTNLMSGPSIGYPVDASESTLVQPSQSTAAESSNNWTGPSIMPEPPNIVRDESFRMRSAATQDRGHQDAKCPEPHRSDEAHVPNVSFASSPEGFEQPRRVEDADATDTQEGTGEHERPQETRETGT
ncbi:hypothetical protein B0A50_02593 [Salinomyces thailandicus]|uniref:Transcription factor TFIIIC triple barrel domain-containing protein n=1 Tax=Salinomyces thailandicus TaxID=706561 RepID=A0A4U0U7F7_9PEZI|nr:hypothetical protein B0A50_02593 [Salinomyces thailandica]